MAEFNDSSASLQLSTVLTHADEYLVGPGGTPVAPDISVSTIFKHSEYEGDVPSDLDIDLRNPEHHVYSRYTQPVTTRVEAILSQIMNGHALTYRSGLTAAYAAIIHYQPKRIAIRGGYHGVHQILRIHKRSVPSLEIIDIDDDLREGDLLWVETPLNPTGEARDLQHYSEKAHKAGVKIVVDATFAPPPLFDPFAWGADCILHSASKYLGGHSDILGGTLVVRTEEERKELWNDRTYLGSVLGSLESFLLLRSLRTLNLRVVAQSTTATALAEWLAKLSQLSPGEYFDGAPGGLIEKVTHSSLQKEEFVAKQHTGGHAPCFAVLMKSAAYAKALPFKLRLFTASTSLGSVESIIEQRLMSDSGADPKLIRLSIGLENLDDLKKDFRQAFKALLE